MSLKPEAKDSETQNNLNKNIRIWPLAHKFKTYCDNLHEL